MRDDVLEVLKRDVARAHRDASFAVAALVEDAETPIRAIAGRSRRGDCVAMLTPGRLIVGGGGLDRVYRLADLATVVVVTTSGGPALFPASTTLPGDMFYVDATASEFARAVREEIARIRPTIDASPIWERPGFTEVIRLEDAGLLSGPTSSPVRGGTVVIVMISGAGVQIRHADASAGVVIPWRAISTFRVEGVDQVQMRPRVGAVLAFGVLGLAARRKEKRAYLTVETDEGEFLIEDGAHLPIELRSLLTPFGVGGTRMPASSRWNYKRLLGAADDESLWKELDGLGAEGWELVSTVETDGHLLLIMKKRHVADDELTAEENG